MDKPAARRFIAFVISMLLASENRGSRVSSMKRTLVSLSTMLYNLNEQANDH